MNHVRTKRTFTREQLEEMTKQIQEERKREIAELDAPELSQEAKELLVDIRRGLRDAREGIGFTIEEMIEILFGEKGICK